MSIHIYGNGKINKQTLRGKTTPTISGVSQDEKVGSCFIDGGNGKWYSHFEKHMLT